MGMQKGRFAVKSLRGKMLLWFGLSLFILLTILGIVYYSQVRDTVIPLTKDLAQEVLMARSAEIGQLIKGYSSNVKSMSQHNLIRRGLWEEIETDLLSQAEMMDGEYEILFFADVDGNYITTLGHEGNIADRDYFYAIMQEGQDSYISNPMISRSTGEEIFVVAHVVINEQGERMGLMAATILLEEFSRIVGSIKIGERGFGYVVDQEGLLFAHPMEELRMTLNLLSASEWGYQGLEEVGEKMIRGEPGLLSYQRPDGSILVSIFHPIPYSPNWSLGIGLCEEELMGTAIDLMQKITYLMIAILIAVVFIIYFISGRIASPVMALKEGVGVISSGNLDYSLQVRTGDELEDLAGAFNKMTHDLKAYIQDLQETTAEKERIESELHVANKIQTSMLPRSFPPYPTIENLDLFATMDPAREVGGDFYDFFLIDDHRFCFSIGDVSGKGIPAALFMVITRTILKNLALQSMSLQELFYQANNILCEENEECMFVTVFMGIIDTRDGGLEYVNAGHNPPLMAREGKEFTYLETQKNIFLGGFCDYEFQTLKTVMGPQDTLFLYTDGVTEAMNEAGELFSDERMFQVLNSLQETDVKAVIRSIREQINAFVQDTPASDDVTLLAVSLNTHQEE